MCRDGGADREHCLGYTSGVFFSSFHFCHYTPIPHRISLPGFSVQIVLLCSVDHSCVVQTLVLSSFR